MNILFWVLLIIIIVFSIIGYVRGLVKSLIRVVLTVVTFIVASLVAPFVGQVIIDTTDIDDNIETLIEKRIQIEVENKVKETYRQQIENEYGEYAEYAEYVDESVINELASRQELSKTDEMDIISQINAPEFVKKLLKENNSKEFMKKIGAENFYEYIAKYIAYMIVKIFAYVFVFILLSLIALCIYIACSGLSKLPVLRGVDKIAGLIFGAIEGIIICWIVLVVFDVAVGLGAKSLMESNDTNRNIVLEKLYETDIIENSINRLIRME